MCGKMAKWWIDGGMNRLIDGWMNRLLGGWMNKFANSELDFLNWIINVRKDG